MQCRQPVTTTINKSAVVPERAMRELVETCLSKKPCLKMVDVELVMEQYMSSRKLHGARHEQIDHIANVASSFSSHSREYSVLAARLLLTDLYESTAPSFSEYVDDMGGIITPKLINLVRKNKHTLDAAIATHQDNNFDMIGLKTLLRSYLLKKKGVVRERPQYLYMRVALGIHGRNIEDALKSYHFMSQRFMTHATPTMFNSGAGKQQLASCFLLAMKEDSIQGIYDTITQCAKISKHAGGIGLNISNIRGSGASIKGTQGVSSGIVPMLRVFNATAGYVDQAGRRKGGFAMYLEPWHPDVEAFLDLKKNTGVESARARDLFYALWTPDLFMKRVKANKNWSLICPSKCPELATTCGSEWEALYLDCEKKGIATKTIPARKLWMHILDTQLETGTPYLMYKDTVNAKSNQKNLGTIRGSNLCVSSTTRILTSEGYFPIDELKDRCVNVWNGEKFTPTTVRQTGVDQPVVDVCLSNATTLKCTPYHKFYVQQSYQSKTPQVLRAHELKPGMRLIKSDYPVIDGKEELQYPYTHGMFCADGTYHEQAGKPHRCANEGKYDDMCGRHTTFPRSFHDGTATCHALVGGRYPGLSLYGEKQQLLSFLDYRTKGTTTNQNKVHLTLPLDLAEKFHVPINASVKDKLLWLAGYLDGDGCALNNNGTQSLQAVSIHDTFLHDVMLLLQTLGVHSSVNFMRGECTKNMPDGRGGLKRYHCKAQWRMCIGEPGVQKLLTLGLGCHRLKFVRRTPNRSAAHYVKVVGVFHNGERSDTFCFTEKERAMGTFEGVLSGNCSEITEFTSPEEVAVCTLASIALPQFVEDGVFNYDKLEDVVAHTVKSLERVIDVTFYPVPEARTSNMRHRPIGIGANGFHDVLFKLRQPWESAEAQQTNKDIFESIYWAAMRASVDLAREFGHYESFPGSPLSEGKFQFDLWGKKASDRYDWDALREEAMLYGARHSLLIALMPTASSAQIIGNTEGVDALTSNLYVRRVSSGEYVVMNKYLEADLEQRGLWCEEIRELLVAHKGSVQKMPIPSKLKDLYKCAFEVTHKSVLDMAIGRGPFVCQSQSMNLHIQDTTRQKLTSSHFYAFDNGLKTASYYVRTKSKVEAVPVTVRKELLETKDTEECEMCSA
jgi:ribonucleoside-diphosphate reductase alpha chain